MEMCICCVWKAYICQQTVDIQKVIRFFSLMFNTTFNNVSVISQRSVLLVKETGGPGENHRPVTSH